ncbi:MAG: UvrD-helicase domain-containing protein [Halioglobus sp.]
MTVVDFQQRQTALDPIRSFCVGAPAGSGKTELLIQRFLTLLARVKRPEQVLAITFTRKAAAEMRERVHEALLDAQRGEPCASEHQKQTRELALAALQADKEGAWQLSRNISRLNIKTIDSFCSHLTRQMPVLSEFGGQAEVIDDAGELYAEAVAELFKLIETENPLKDDLSELMLHFDNNWSRLQELLVSMLARRDQWRDYIGVHHRADEAEAYLLHTVNGIVTDSLQGLSNQLGAYSQELLALQQFACSNLGKTPPARFPGASPDDLQFWRDLRTLLLTAGKAGKWRSRVDKRLGFPADKGLAQEQKAKFLELGNELRDIDGLEDDLNAVMTLPEMEPESDSWRLVLHLSRILPRLAAELLLVFQGHGKVDHSQISLSALQAMGEDEMPTELALRLDYQLEHILVDEFQDTAINQFELVRRLTRGWGEHNDRNPGSPRTLLVVGDGMQSIYGFRDANVGLFLRARNEGFNGVRLEYLPLQCNFRSDEGIVSWVNNTFERAFPTTEDVSKGQIRFSEAVAVKPAGASPAVVMRSFSGDSASQLEVEAISTVVQEGIADPNCQSIAILARTRGHLQPILENFKALGILYSAQDIDNLASSSVIVDLLSLCKALGNPADRVAWMAILRAPWCGLGLNDLHTLATAGSYSAHTPIASTLIDEEILFGLTTDGRERVSLVSTALAKARLGFERLPLRVWVEQLWLELGGAAAVSSASELPHAERFFQLLEQAELEGQGLSVEWLEGKLQKLFIQAENPDSKVQVMTLHKAKGLEFDWVLIPSLQKTTRVNAKPLLLWDDHSNAEGERGFLLAADDHSKDGDPSLFNWLKAQRANKEILELTRLLYVGATRAVQRLFLTAQLKFDEKKEIFPEPPKRSLLAPIWQSFSEQMETTASILEPKEAMKPDSARPFYRLQKDTVMKLRNGQSMPVTTPDQDSNIPQRKLNRVDRYVGTVVHLALEQLSLLDDIPEVSSPLQLRRWEHALASLGLFDEALSSAVTRVEQSVNAVLADDQGRWILSSKHFQADSELRLTRVDSRGRLVDIIIDRTFVDEQSNERWVVDYKNSQPEVGETYEDFVEREENTYRAQLEGYREAMTVAGDQPVNCALYFTALARLHRVSEAP